MAKILLVEDDLDIRKVMAAQLSSEDHEVSLAIDGNEGVEKVESQSFDLCILDWMLPGLSGVEICKRIRLKYGTKLPVLMVTAKAEPEYIVQGLDAGADDYVTKPFDMDIFLARVRALLRRKGKELAGAKGQDILEVGPLKIDSKRFQVLNLEREVTLTASEFKILKALMEVPGIVLTRKQLVEQVLGTGVNVVGRTIDTQLVSIRKKLGESGDLIETIRGIGYRFKELEG